jgi:imidazolonepropionase-like amidohydrolase
MKRLALLAASSLAFSAAAAAQTAPAEATEPVKVIHAGTLIAEPGQAPLRNATVIVRGRQIAEVRQGFAEVPGAQVIDLRTATVLPGLIDMHVHLNGLDDRMQSRLQAPFRDYEDEAYHGSAERSADAACRLHDRSRPRR